MPLKRLHQSSYNFSKVQEKRFTFTDVVKSKPKILWKYEMLIQMCQQNEEINTYNGQWKRA